MRLRNIPGVEERLLQYPTFVQDPTLFKGRWHERFHNNNPIHLEIGCGKGRFITTLAERHPEINFIALEKQAEVIYRTAQRTEYRDIPNLVLTQYDATLLPNIFADGELDRLYLNFSDPWPKKRHYKRRLMYRSFLQMYKQVLTPNGEIHIKTDNESLFEFSLNELSHEHFQLRHITFDLHQSDLAEQNVMTEYEQRFAGRGQRIYRTEAIILPISNTTTNKQPELAGQR